MNDKQICQVCGLCTRNKPHTTCEQDMQNEVEEANMLSGLTIRGGEMNGYNR